MKHQAATRCGKHIVGKLEGGRMRLLATQTCCSEHATRMAQEYLRCAPTRDRRYASSAQRSGHCSKRRAGLWSKSQVELFGRHFCKTRSQGKNMDVDTHLHDFRLAGVDEFKSFACPDQQSFIGHQSQSLPHSDTRASFFGAVWWRELTAPIAHQNRRQA